MDECTSPAEARARARGELAAIHYASKAEERAASNCPGKHGLVQFMTERSFGCNLCKKRVVEGSLMRGCRRCDYDICRECSDAAGYAENFKSKPQLPRSPASYDEVLATAREKAKQRKVELDKAATIHRLAAERATQELATRTKHP